MIPEFKIHCSSIIEIMGGAMTSPTALQLATIADLSNKKLGKGLTAKQEETLANLIAKRDSKPLLQEGAKTFCRKWVKQQSDVYNRKQVFSNKFTEKGILQEGKGIELTCRIMGYDSSKVKKNELQFENEFINRKKI